MAAAAFVTDLTEILTQVAEAAGGVAGLINGFDMLEISRDYYDLYKQQRDWYYATMQNGVELPLIAEVNAILPYSLNYVARVGTMDGSLGPFGGESGDMMGWWTRHSNMYHTVPAPEIVLYEADEDLMRIKVDWTNYLFRYEEHWFDVRNDIRWNRRFMIHNIGIKQAAVVSVTLASSFGNYQREMEDTGFQLATFANGAARYAGYRRGMNDTNDAFTGGNLPSDNAKQFLATDNNRTYRSKNAEADTLPDFLRDVR